MRILLDTNIVIDVALQREPYFEQSDRITGAIALLHYKTVAAVN